MKLFGFYFYQSIKDFSNLEIDLKQFNPLMPGGLKSSHILLNPSQDGPFCGGSRMGVQKGPLLKFCHTYPTMMKLGTVIP